MGKRRMWERKDMESMQGIWETEKCACLSEEAGRNKSKGSLGCFLMGGSLVTLFACIRTKAGHVILPPFRTFFFFFVLAFFRFVFTSGRYWVLFIKIASYCTAIVRQAFPARHMTVRQLTTARHVPSPPVPSAWPSLPAPTSSRHVPNKISETGLGLSRNKKPGDDRLSHHPSTLLRTFVDLS